MCFQEAIKLAFIRQFFHHVEATHFSNDRLVLEIFNQARNRSNAFKSLYDKCFQNSSERIASAADAQVCLAGENLVGRIITLRKSGGILFINGLEGGRSD